jgi:uncharacterized protein
MRDLTTVSVLLRLFTALLVSRVLGQLIVAGLAPKWLPPFDQWQSGILPYAWLLAGQAVVLVLMVWISSDFSRGSGYWIAPHPLLGRAALAWSYLYFGAMAIRYVLRMTHRRDQRWFGGTIPIIFHSLVAAFQWTFGTYHAAGL